MFFQRLVCCQTDENVYQSDDDSSSGDELGPGATAAVMHWPQEPADHAAFLSQGAGSIRVLPSSTRHTSRHRKSDSVAVIPSEPPSRGPGRDGKEESAGRGALGGAGKGWAASLVSLVSCVIR